MSARFRQRNEPPHQRARYWRMPRRGASWPAMIALALWLGIGLVAAIAIGGYTAFDDVSARNFQMSDSQWLRVKSQDSFAPMGPWLVTADELGDGSGLEIECRVNGEVRQKSNTRHLIFNVPFLISYLSSVMTLHPGDVISTGTPAGVGFARSPQVFLEPGDVVEVEIEKIGRLENPVVEAPRS